MHSSLIFALKHRLWERVPIIYVFSKNKKNITIFHMKIIIFTVVKNLRIWHGHFCVILCRWVQEVDQLAKLYPVIFR